MRLKKFRSVSVGTSFLHININETFKLWYCKFEVLGYKAIKSVLPTCISLKKIDKYTFGFDECYEDIIKDIQVSHVHISKEQCIDHYNSMVYYYINMYKHFKKLSSQSEYNDIQIDILKSYFIDTDYLMEEILRNGSATIY